MEELLSSWWGILVTVSGGLAIIIGFVKSIDSIREWHRKKANEQVEREHMEERIMKAVDDLDKSIQQRDEIQSKRIDELFTRLENIDKTMGDVQEQSSALTYDKLMAAYTKYGIKQSPISLSTLTSLERIYSAYAKNGRNHIPADFLERLRGCPVEG